ncbi:hypothetical protein GW17_00057724 [Ensete ventricosum]|nr:hypothetical protein GW17_00057724 [Ensete ventricosum]
MWYNRLRPSSIFYFNQLATEFELNFLANAQPRPTVTSLLGISQKDDEPLAQFVAGFAIEIQGMPDTHPLLVIQAFLIRLPVLLLLVIGRMPTYDCHDLKNHIEDLICQGHLGLYVRKSREPSPHPKGPVEKQIDVIVGGPASGGDSSSARKAYAWATVEKRARHERNPEITLRLG